MIRSAVGAATWHRPWLCDFVVGKPLSPSLTIAIVTRNRPGSLRRLLTSLKEQRNDEIEVVISDDSDTDYEVETRELAATFGCRYMVGPRRGLYANRNASALAATAAHVRTMDDDHELPSGHIDACLAAIARDPFSVWTLSELRPGDPTGDGRGIPPGQLNARGFSEPPARAAPCWAIADGATIYPRFIFLSGHRFVEDFAYGASYLEFGSRLHAAGYRIRHLQDTYVVHHWEPRQNFNHRTDLASTVFAMLAHSLVYQPTVRNRILTAGEVGKQLAIHPVIGPISVLRGMGVYRRRAPMLRSAARGTGVPTTADHRGMTQPADL